MKLDLGSLRELGDIEQDSRTGNDPNPVYTGRPFIKGVPSEIASVGGSETFRGRQLKSETTHVVEMHRMDGIQPDMRYHVTGGAYAGSILHIMAVRDMTAEGIPMRMQLDCKQLNLVD